MPDFEEGGTASRTNSLKMLIEVHYAMATVLSELEDLGFPQVPKLPGSNFSPYAWLESLLPSLAATARQQHF